MGIVSASRKRKKKEPWVFCYDCGQCKNMQYLEEDESDGCEILRDVRCGRRKSPLHYDDVSRIAKCDCYEKIQEVTT